MITVFKGFVSLVTILCLKCAYWIQTIFNSNKRFHLTSGLCNLCTNAASNQMEIWQLRLQGHAKTVGTERFERNAIWQLFSIFCTCQNISNAICFLNLGSTVSSLTNAWDNKILKTYYRCLSITVWLVDWLLTSDWLVARPEGWE